MRLSARRSAGFALEPLTYPAIEAFLRLSGTRLAPWELRLIEDLDNIFRSVHSRKATDVS